MKIIKGVNHVSFTVSNLTKSVKFYEKVFGFILVDKSKRDAEFAQKATGFKNAQLEIAYLRLNCFTLELVEYIFPKGVKLDTSTNNVGSSHICFDARDVDKISRLIIKHEGVVKLKPVEIPAGPNKGRYMFYAKDIDGNNLELIGAKTK